MSFLERARERALAATEQVRAAAGQVASKAEGIVDEASDGEERQPVSSTHDAFLHHGIESARASLASLVERLDPRLVADLVIKATSIQERANAALHEKGSAYRIDGISITATIPPQISFSIGRSAAVEDLLSADDPARDLGVTGQPGTSYPTAKPRR